MLELWKTLTQRQFEAALATLDAGIAACPDASWNAPVANMKFCQVAFHTLFFADCYLSADNDAMLAQPFHREHREFFRDYEEMEDRPQQLLYDRPTVLDYLAHCRAKAPTVIAAETADSLAARCGFSWLTISRAELHVYNIRHIQHHAAQLSLRLRLDAGADIRWVKSGWRPA